MSNAINFAKEQIVVFDSFEKKEDVLKTLSDVLLEKGYTKESYYDALIEREAAFPTGLYTEGINIAIPHCDIANVKKDAICVGILKSGTEFKRMDEPEEDIKINIVIMLALTEAHGQLEMLQKVVTIIQDQDKLKKILESCVDEVYEIIKENLL